MQTEINIFTGTAPSIDPIYDNSSLVNAFVGTDNNKQYITRTPSLEVKYNDKSYKKLFYTALGNHVVIGENSINYIGTDSVNKLAEIKLTTNNPNISENQKGELTITGGDNIYVYSQKESTLTLLNGIVPINSYLYTASLNNFTFVSDTNSWCVSEPNQSQKYSTGLVVENDATLGNITGLSAINNNMYILCTNGVQRVVPAIVNRLDALPFQIDPNYRTKYGCSDNLSIANTGAGIYYLTREGKVIYLTNQGELEVTNKGISESIRKSNSQVIGASYIYFKGEYIYVLSLSDITYLFVESTKTWSTSDNFNLIDYDGTYIINKDGISTLSTKYAKNSYFHITSRRIIPDSLSSEKLKTLNSVKLFMTSGLNESLDVKVMISKDNVNFTTVSENKTKSIGIFNSYTTSRFNIASVFFCIKISIYGNSDTLITNAYVDIH